MIRKEELVIMRSIALCFKQHLKVEEALVYTNLKRTQFSKNAEIYSVYKSPSGYYRRKDLDRMMQGIKLSPEEAMKQLQQSMK